MMKRSQGKAGRLKTNLNELKTEQAIITELFAGTGGFSFKNAAVDFIIGGPPCHGEVLS